MPTRLRDWHCSRTLVEVPWHSERGAKGEGWQSFGPALGICHYLAESAEFPRNSPRNCHFSTPTWWRTFGITAATPRVNVVNSTYFGLLAEFGEANIPLDRVAPKYFGLSFAEARRRAPAKGLPCRAFRLGGQKSPWLVSATDLAELIDARRQKAG